MPNTQNYTDDIILSYLNGDSVLCKHTGISQKNITRNHSIYRVRWSNKNEILSICEILYKDCDDHFLKRKYEKYQQLKNGDDNNELYEN